jgi:hypothetical protein
LPTSAWLHSISSTRRTRDRFEAWCRKPAAAVAAAAAVVAAAEAAVVVQEAAVAQAVPVAPSQAAACRGELAASGAKPLALSHGADEHKSWPGLTTSTRPILVFFAVPPGRACATSRMTTVLDSNFRAMLVSKQDRTISVAGSCALRQRSGAVDKMRVLKS